MLLLFNGYCNPIKCRREFLKKNLDASKPSVNININMNIHPKGGRVKTFIKIIGGNIGCGDKKSSWN